MTAAKPKRPAARRAKTVAPSAADAGELLGAHVSIAGGTQEAPPRAKAIGATAIQMFTKMANRWAERAVDAEEQRAFREGLAATDVRVTVVHDSYLINLASPDPVLRRRSIESFVAELQRCAALGITYLVSHPGNFMDERASGVRRNADAIAEALERVPGKTVLCMETTAGAGTVIGSTFEELALLLELVPAAQRKRMGICLDTCHVYSAGYDLVKDFDGVWSRFDDVLGAKRLKVLHLNDSKMPFDSRRDRHELIAEGTLGAAPFRRIMNESRFHSVAKVLETPKLDDATKTDRQMLARLRGYAADG
ncbi:MAG TPA: deoxyribonuclease IV [Gemmatimonadaceae bacterium]